MKDFDDYKKTRSGSCNGNSDIFSAFSEFAAKYEGKNSDELIAAIIAEADRSRKNGTLTDADIDKFVSSIEPMLNFRQKKILNSVVAKIKEDHGE